MKGRERGGRKGVHYHIDGLTVYTPVLCITSAVSCACVVSSCDECLTCLDNSSIGKHLKWLYLGNEETKLVLLLHVGGAYH